VAKMLSVEFIEKLSNDISLEPIFYHEDKLRFYCAGGAFLTLSKTGSPTKHKYLNYFDTIDQRETFIKAKPEDAYKVNSDIYNSSKDALMNRAMGRRPLTPEAMKTQDHFERLYQQTIVYNNRPGKDKTCGVASFSFGISSTYLRGNDKKGATFVDVVWVDEIQKRIVFIEYKQGTKALDGASGVVDHCAKTFLTMNNKTVKKEALARYFAKKAFHSGNFCCRALDFLDIADKVVDEYESICCLMFTNLPNEVVMKEIKKLKEEDGARILERINAINPDAKVKMKECLERTFYIHADDYNSIVLSMALFLPVM